MKKGFSTFKREMRKTKERVREKTCLIYLGGMINLWNIIHLTMEIWNTHLLKISKARDDFKFKCIGDLLTFKKSRV